MTGFRVIIVAALLVPTFAAELPVIRLDTIFPPGGKAGAEVDAAVTGADLDDAKTIHFSHPGITGEAKEKRFLIKIAPDVPAGIYDARVTGLLGISNPRAFAVSGLPQSVEPATNNKPETAADLALDSTVSGNATAAAADYFKFTAKAGQRLILDCAAAELDSQLTPILAVLNASGRELAAAPRGGMLDFAAPADGVFLARVHDLTFAGGPNHFYQLTLTTGPHLEFVMPPCAKAGTKSKFVLFGRNLPGGTPANIAGHDGKPLDRLEVEIDAPAKADFRADGLLIPAAATVPGFPYRLGSSNAVFIGFTDLPIVAEQEEKLAVPCEVSGQYFPAADTDIHTFDAKKGEVWFIEIISRRLGLPTSPFLLVQRDAADLLEAYGSDANSGGARFNTASGDPTLRFEVKEDGTYRITTRDLFGGSRKDPRNVYRLVIRKEAPDFQLIALAEPRPEKADDRSGLPRAALVRADATFAMKVLAVRRDGFAGDIELHAENLPPGVTSIPTKIAAGANDGLLLLTSVEKPERWAGAIRVSGKAKIGETDIVREARGGAVRWTVADANNDAVRGRLTRDIALAVSAEPSPVSVAAVEEKRWEIPAGGKIELPLRVARRGEFKEVLKLKAAGAPGIETMKELEVAPDAATATATIDLATAKIPVGEHVIRFEAQTKGKFRGKDVITTVFSAPIRIAVLPPEAK